MGVNWYEHALLDFEVLFLLVELLLNLEFSVVNSDSLLKFKLLLSL